MKAKPPPQTDLFGRPAAKPQKAAPGRRKRSSKPGEGAASARAAAAEQQAAGIVSVIVPVPNAEAYSYAVSGPALAKACAAGIIATVESSGHIAAPAAAGAAAAPGSAAAAPLLPEGALVRVPLGARIVPGIVSAAAPPAIAAKKLRFIAEICDCPPLPAELMRFIRFVASYTLAPVGMVARMALPVPAALSPLPRLEALRYTGKQPGRATAARAKALALAAKMPVWTRAGLAHAAGVSAGVIDGLRQQGVFAEAFLPPAPIVAPPQADYAPPQLSDSQARAAGELCLAAKAGEFSATLLEGVTGSGKTEVYCEAVAEVLRQGKQALILLPEIALTGEMLKRFAARFGAPPAAWHSELTPQQREKTWRQVAEGQIRIVAGARSALFLPFAELGLIIVDEEHDSSYKQEDHVFYNARDMAVARAAIAGLPVILASATPSVESLVNVLQRRYRHVYLPSRFGGSALPQLTAVDLRKTPPPKGRFLSPPLTAAVSAALAKGEQSLLFLNRRGYAPLTLCRACGYHFSCPHCSAWLVEHKSRAFSCSSADLAAGPGAGGGAAGGAEAGSAAPGAELVCHHCEFHRPVPAACPECGALDSLTPVGPGVERIAREAAELWPQARQLVLSADTAQSVQKMRAELDAVARGEVDIIIGTQLVAKGHHFPKMTLVGVVDADIGLNNGDLRAGERSFQLLSQVTGRAGRESAGARGLIQTYQPENPAVKALAHGDGRAFIRREIEERAAYHLPPFGRLAGIIVSGEDRAEAESYARELRRLSPEAAGISLLGPAEAPLARLRRRWRFRLLVQAAGRNLNIQAYIRAMLNAAPKPKAAVRVQIDIDPQSFL